MGELAQGKCEACRVGAPRVTDEERSQLQPQIPDWTVVERDANGISRSGTSSTPCSSRTPSAPSPKKRVTTRPY